ncbi:capsule biosynthesis protein [Billgrantia diversa]|uniref:capsule biosynthesis protein n=1 Tax=Halomonas sp. MCCC 1A13316 TaxID=2733487 RepID=UPI0018D3A4CF|nr:capsular biosynthesis protein [Halomonas sp. MCCC 1A13316]
MYRSGRSFLLLQGPCTAFFRRLAIKLNAQGHRVTALNFNAGDALFRSGLQQIAFRAPLDELPGFLKEIWQRHEITDQVMFGDRRAVHRPSILEARSHGIRNHIFEEGYLRPFWITHEREGVNGHSLLPRDPDWYRHVAGRLGPLPTAVRFRSSFRVRAVQDVAYHVAGLYNPLGYRHYRNHAPVTAPVEYLGYIKRFTRLRWQRRHRGDAACIERLRRQSAPYYVLPLQLNGDAQVRDHSDFEHMGQVIENVMTSFARHAPQEARLVIKNHPLDMGLLDYESQIEMLAKRLELNDRIEYLEAGNLDRLLAKATGLVTVNSTSGLVSLEHGCPTLTLSDPIYAMPGLTHQGDLDSFWQHPQRPQRDLYQAFRTTLLHTVQVNGGFYCTTGIDLAVANTLSRLTAERSPLETLLECQLQTA